MKIAAIAFGLASAVCALPIDARGRAVTPIREFRLTARVTEVRLPSGERIPAWAYEGQVPGPEIRVQEGERVRVILTNALPVATSLHWHGIDVPWTMDGVPGVTQKPVAPGETFVYEFVARPAGTRFYHAHGSAHGDEATQLDMGLYGAFVIEGAAEPRYDRDLTLVLSERPAALRRGPGAAAAAAPGGHDATTPGPAPHGAGSAGMGMHGMPMMGGPTERGAAAAGGHAAGDLFFVNGQIWPFTAPLRVRQGERVRIRLINAGSTSMHPMHLHGHSVRVIAIDGHPLPAPIRRDVLPLMPGERYDVELVADNPGVWLFHCHELHHAGAGMALLLQYEGYEPVGGAATPPATPAAGGHTGH